MISNQILQKTIEELKEATKVDFCIMNVEGQVLVSTENELLRYHDVALAFIASSADNQSVRNENNNQFFKVSDNQELEYILLASGPEENVYMIGRMAVLHIESLLVAYKERFDNSNFLKNLLLDNLLLVDIYSRAKKLDIDTEVRRVMIIVEMDQVQEADNLMLAQSSFLDEERDFVIVMDEKNIVIMKEMLPEEGYEQVEQIAREISEGFQNEKEVRIAYGTIISDIREASKSYKEAKLSLEVGKVFFEEKDVIAYNSLGIGRLIYQLPIPLCKMFIKEIFDGETPVFFGADTLETINKFFENSLNVSEASRQLYIHRNTLVYRLDKIQKQTGLDLRNFEEALIFKIAMMVIKYMKYMETQGY